MNIQEMAKQAGFEQVMRHRDGSSTVLPNTMFERFAALVLEEAANAVDAMKAPDGYNIQEKSLYDVATMEAADAIRALKGAKE